MFRRISVFLVLAASLAGCAGDKPASHNPIKGEVKLDGQPMENGSIMFRPIGDGKGKIVERGFLAPPNFHTDNSRGFAFYEDPETKAPYRIPLREIPPGYIFEVITKGYGGMPDYASQIPLADRWRIAAYVKALQLSQNKTETERALGGKK